MRNLLGIITCSFMIGIFCVNQPLLAVVPWCAASALIFLGWQRPPVWLPAAAAVLFLACGQVRVWQDNALPAGDISRLTGQTAAVEGWIDEEPRRRPLLSGQELVTYVLDTQGYRNGKEWRSCCGKISVTLRQAAKEPVLAAGSRAEVYGQLIALHSYNNPGQYDSAAALWRQGFRGRITAAAGCMRQLPGQRPSYGAGKLRQQLKERLRQVMPQREAAVLSGMLFGGYEDIPADVTNAFTATGLIHILSVSGSHIALLAGLMTGLGEVLAARRLVGQWAVLVLPALAISAYSWLCGFSPPVLRALISGLAVILAGWTGRQAQAANLLWLAALLLLAYCPGWLYDLSFQLSFGCAAGLVYVRPPLAVWLQRWLPKTAACLAAPAVAAQLAVLPVLAWYFNGVSVSAVAASLLILPLLEFIMAAGLAGTVLSILWGWPGSAVLAVCSLLLRIGLLVTGWLAALPGSLVYVPVFAPAAALLYYLLLAFGCGWRPRRLVLLQAALGAYCKKRLWAAAAAGLAVWSMIWLMWPRPLAVHFIDVGQGDATLFVTPGGRTVLVDAGGGASEPGGFDVGQRVVLPYLRHYGLPAIDYLLLTHGHEDHAGGAAAVLQGIAAKQLLLPREAYTRAEVAAVAALRPGSALLPLYAGQSITLDGVTFTVLQAGGGDHPGNETSCVVKAVYGQHSFLLTGDLDSEGERQLLAGGDSLKSTVLKAGHHGARNASCQEFVQNVQPEHAVISAGFNNRFGHPHPETLARLASARIWRTDRQGAIVMKSNGRQMSVTPFIKENKR